MYWGSRLSLLQARNVVVCTGFFGRRYSLLVRFKPRASEALLYSDLSLVSKCVEPSSSHATVVVCNVFLPDALAYNFDNLISPCILL